MRLKLLAALVIPLGLDLYLPVPEDNPISVERIEMGRRLFFDSRLSRDESVSCASCHDPARAFSDGRPVAVGIFGRQGTRNAPALVNRAYGRAFFWDARAKTLEEQVLKPIEDPNEMGFSPAEAASRVAMTERDMAYALASYVRSILSGSSRFDRYIAGERNTLTAEEEQGLRLFRGKANCVVCHVGPTLTDERLHNTGVAWRNNVLADIGGGRGDFKTPTLRDLTRTAPYMHDGSIATLPEVVAFYASGGRANPALDPEIRPLQLSDSEKTSLVAFLRTLNGVIQEGVR